MDLSAHLVHRLQEVLLSGRWIAHTNCSAVLENVSFEQATTKVHDLNTIAALTFHITYYLRGLNEVFAGGDLTIRDTFSFDFNPPANQTEWDALVKDLREQAHAFIDFVAAMDNAKLEGPFVKEEYGSNLLNIEAIIEHTYYHLGQISLLKKMIS